MKLESKSCFLHTSVSAWVQAVCYAHGHDHLHQKLKSERSIQDWAEPVELNSFNREHHRFPSINAEIFFSSSKERPLSLVRTTCQEWELAASVPFPPSSITFLHPVDSAFLVWLKWIHLESTMKVYFYVLNLNRSIIFLSRIHTWLLKFLGVILSSCACFIVHFLSAFNRSVWRWTNKSQWQAGVLTERLAVFLSVHSAVHEHTSVTDRSWKWCYVFFDFTDA